MATGKKRLQVSWRFALSNFWMTASSEWCDSSTPGFGFREVLIDLYIHTD